jgi:hypothetical protein
MQTELVTLEIGHLKKLMVLPPDSPITPESYFSEGSAAYCLLADGNPVFAGGIVNLQWNRGEAWITPNDFFHRNVKTCFRILKKMLPEIAASKKFRRIQAVCSANVPETLFLHLGFEYEATLKAFGPFGERCKMFSRIFGDAG